MDRLACVDLPAFPLQLLLQDHAEWREHPTVVVEHDRPQGKILWTNTQANHLGVRAGMSYAAGLSLTAALRAGVISAERQAQGCVEVAKHLRRFSPEVEAFADEPGGFWVNASGFERLFPDLKAWGDRLRIRLRAENFYSVVVVGWSRFGSFAVARGRRPARGSGTLVLRDAKQEHSLAQRVPLDRLGLAPKTRDWLEKLGVYTVGALQALPAGGLHERFGPELLRLHRLATGIDPLPLQPTRPEPALEVRRDLEPPVAEITRLVFYFSHLLHPLLARLASRGHALSQLSFSLYFEDGAPLLDESFRPAAPTLEAPQLLHLLNLRLEHLSISAPVEEILLAVEGVPATEEQLLLFVEAPRRDLEAADRALARVRAELGNDAVVHAVLREGHLPEASFGWEPLDQLPLPRCDASATPSLVRRIHNQPQILPPRPRNEPDGWLLAELEAGPVIKNSGPYLLSGAWWHRLIQREYHFAELNRGDIVWVYHDRRRRSWYLQGVVE